ncbi:MAG: hypothetical protein K6F56_01520 [Oscillospiraceae bacterium]|nr:hypothetical protein [Oscillospiraceae bacterium]
MRRQSKQRLTALLLALLLPVLGACGAKQKTEEMPAETPAVNNPALEGFSRAEDFGRNPLAFSNMLFPDSALTAEQKTLIDSVQQIVDAAVFDSELFMLELENTCPFSINGDVYTLFLDNSGTILSENSYALNYWEPGMRRLIEYNSYYAENLAAIEIEIGFYDDAHWYRTSLRKLEYQNAPGDPGEIKIVNPYVLPRTFHTDSWGKAAYRVDAIDVYSTGYYTFVTMDMTMAQASSGQNDEIHVRLINEKGIVRVTDEVYNYGIKAKEKLHLLFTFYDLEPGTYTVDILEY